LAAATTERIVVDPRTGLAIAGMDPVAYFLEAAARPGLPEHQATWSGAAWRFRNAGNRAAFLASPAVYAPVFGGHDPVVVARGYIAEGDPELFAIAGDRLYLFQTREALATFLAAPQEVIAQATLNWPRLAMRLSR
jgi:hypothetical protein